MIKVLYPHAYAMGQNGTATAVTWCIKHGERSTTTQDNPAQRSPLIMETNKKAKLTNVLVGIKGDKLVLTIDLKAFHTLDTENIARTESGNLRFADSTGRYIKLDGALDGLQLKLDLIANKDKVEELRNMQAQKATAMRALDEMSKAGITQALGTSMGIDAATLAQAIAIAQTLNAQNLANAAKA
jgi:hypothetical protein